MPGQAPIFSKWERLPKKPVSVTTCFSTVRRPSLKRLELSGRSSFKDPKLVSSFFTSWPEETQDTCQIICKDREQMTRRFWKERMGPRRARPTFSASVLPASATSDKGGAPLAFGSAFALAFAFPYNARNAARLNNEGFVDTIPVSQYLAK